MTAVYWGQLAECDSSYKNDVDQYSCDNKEAYRATCAFATLIFIVMVFFTAGLIAWRSEFIDEVGLYDEISGAAGGPNPMMNSTPYEPASSFSQPATSTDL